MSEIPDLFPENPLVIFPGEANKIANGNNAAAIVTLAAAVYGQWAVGIVTVGYNDTPTGGLLTVNDSATPVFQVPITQSGSIPIPVYRYGGRGAPMTIVLSAGGNGITGYLNVEAAQI